MASDKSNGALPPIKHVLETGVYVKDKAKSMSFYTDLFGKEPFLDMPGFCAYGLGETVLLLFQLGKTKEDWAQSRGVIPGHGPSQEVLDLIMPADSDVILKQHYCLGVQNWDEVAAYEKRLKDKGVHIIATNEFDRGGRSVYFSDPDGHVVEIGSRGIWPDY